MRNLFFFLLLLPIICQAQVDSTYIAFYPQKLSVSPFISKNFIFLIQEFESGDNKTYMPNNPVNLGTGISWNNSIINFSYGHGFDFMRDKALGKTKAMDFQYHTYGRKIAFDIFLQQYQGFYLDEEEKKHDDYELFPDMKIRQYGLFTHYILNHKKFSYAAAFTQSEQQLKSTGSILIGLGVYDTKIQTDSCSILDNITTIRNFQFGVSAGYAYNWVVNRHWLVHGSVTTGINFGNEKLNRIGKDRLEVYPTVFPRVSTCYNKEKWSVGFSYVSNFIFPSFSDDSSIGISAGSFRLTCTYRFDKTFPLLDRLPF